MPYFAHSARKSDGMLQSYSEHVGAVRCGALERADAMLYFCPKDRLKARLRDAIEDAAIFHDLGKLDPDNQTALQQGRGEGLPWDHIDAGVAHLMAMKAETAAWLVRAHHAPGLPEYFHHFNANDDPHLRGCRNDDTDVELHEKQTAKTDATLAELIKRHTYVCGGHGPRPYRNGHGLPLRLSLSCLVDADHADTALFDRGENYPAGSRPHWQTRLERLDAYVECLPPAEDPQRQALRKEFYNVCRNGSLHEEVPLVACEGTVGIGKTTALAAWALRKAIATRARRIFIVAPFTAILAQTAERLRRALVLPSEDHGLTLAEHHHRADFSSREARDLATLWSTPIVLTTAVQFFETLASNHPGALRKLHALPGSVIVIDEAHAALPAPLLQQNWRWMRELAEDWHCTIVYASGSLARYWEYEDIVGADATRKLPEIVPPSLAKRATHGETKRVRYKTLGRLSGSNGVAAAIEEHAGDGGALVVMNTVQSAAVMAKTFAERGHDVLHLSTALCPHDRKAILEDVVERLMRNDRRRWLLVATSLIEAGVDLSFRTAFRERFSVSSLIQIGGRVNRHGGDGIGTVWDFFCDAADSLIANPAANASARVVEVFWEQRRFQGAIDPAQLTTLALCEELRGRVRNDALTAAEEVCSYPDVAKLGRVIDCDTRLVVVDPSLRDEIIARSKPSFGRLLDGSVQIQGRKLEDLGLDDPILPGKEIYWWPHKYEQRGLGYMAGVLDILKIGSGAPVII